MANSPENDKRFLGIDLTSSQAKPTACAILDGAGSVVRVTRLYSDADILDLAASCEPSIVAIDAPLDLPKGMCCLEESCDCSSVWPHKGRWGEQELVRRGIHLYITSKRSIIKKMVYRAIELADTLRRPDREVIEVYPYASKVILLGMPIPKKTTREGLEFLKERLGALVPGMDRYAEGLDHDGYDALMAAHTAYLHSTGSTEAVGAPEEVPIVIPRRN